VDPGVFTQEDAAEAADAVLITHEHLDHYEPGRLRRTDAPIFTIEAVATRIRADAPDVAERVTVVRPEDTWTIGGPGGPGGAVDVRAVGELHAVIHPELPRVTNSGYLLAFRDGEDATAVFHPGDALTGPEVPVDILLAPVSAPWMKISEGIEFARSVGAPRNVAIHDRIYSDAGLGVADGHFDRFLGTDGLDYTRLADGTDL
jgi:L-ascorbate metabolism protein UlaG (beta-lactamase superfamily)